MGIKEILQKFHEKKARLNEIQEEERLHKMAYDRTKSPHERELEVFLKEEREKEIKKQLDYFRKKRAKEIWSPTNQILHQKNIFKTNPKEKILSQKNIFQNGGGMDFLGKGQFF